MIPAFAAPLLRRGKRLRSFRLRASRYGGQVAASARPARRRFGVIVLMAAAILFGSSSPVFACPVCFGAEETSMIAGAKIGVLVMLGILLAVQGGFVGFFLYLRKRAKRTAEVELDAEWSELQRSPRTS
jgi:hypothetical protein